MKNLSLSLRGEIRYMNRMWRNLCFISFQQTFHTPSLGDEEFEIPPITPPPESDPALSMPDVLPFQGLSDPLPSQGSEFTPQFPPQSLDLPSITISRNLVEQDGVLHSSGLHMVGSTFIDWKCFFFSIICASHGKDLRLHVLKHAPAYPRVDIWIVRPRAI